MGSIKRKKVYIPDNPDVNFLGLLIGPKGVTQKQLQESSGAKIIIRGKGASKDGGSSNTGHPDDNDELHVSIEGGEEAVERATKEIQKILFNPDQAQKLKSEQLKQLQDINSDPNIYGPNSGLDGYQIELRVPNNMVGLIIGKGGENIVKIQTQLQVQAVIAKESDMKPGETLRSIVLKGSKDNVNEAKKRIDDIIQTQQTKMGGGVSTNSNIQKELDLPFITKLPVPNDKVGIIIGKGGMTIKGVQERTRSTVQIPQGPDADNPAVRTLIIGAETQDSVIQAQQEILLVIQAQHQNALNAYNAPSNSLAVIVPDDKVGIVIGKGGISIKEIQTRLQVKVHIPQGPDVGSFPPVRTISIIGQPEAQQRAKYEIEMIVAGTPINNNSSNPYSYGGASAASYYGSSYYNDPYSSYQYSTLNYYDPSQYLQASTAAATSSGAITDSNAVSNGQSTANAASSEDPTSYYNDFWIYAQYYGEAAARLYYGAWSPPEGTQPPEGVVLPTQTQPADSIQKESTVSSTSQPVIDQSTSSNTEQVSEATVENTGSSGTTDNDVGNSNFFVIFISLIVNFFRHGKLIKNNILNGTKLMERP